MKRTQFLDACRNIRAELVAYISILVISMLAAAAFLSVSYTADALKKDALHFFNSNRLWDFEISSAVLLEEEDLAAVRALDGVEAAERVLQASARLRIGEASTDVAVISLPETISLPVLCEGRLPETAAECAVEKELLDKNGLSLGQKIRLSCSRAAGIDPLLEENLVITGVFQTPDHITYMIPATPYILVPAESFNREALDGAFMQLRVRVAGTPADRYSDAYRETVKPVGEALQALGEQRAPARLEKLRAEYERRLHDGQAQLDEAAEQLRQGREKLDAGQRELEAAAEQLGLGKATLDTGASQLSDANAQLEAGMAELRQGKAQLDLVESYLKKGESWIREHITEADWPQDIGISYADFLGYLGRGENWIMGLLYEHSGYNGGLARLRAAISEYERGRLDWYYLGEEYLDAVARLEQGRKQLEEGQRELADGQIKYDEAERTLREGRAQLEQLTANRWTVLDCNGNPGFVYAEGNAQKLSSLSMSFSSIFLIVGTLVIYATIVRMVEQQRSLVGTAKAMGLYNREIFAKYMFFAGSAVLLGVGLGVVLSWLPLQRALLRSYEDLFTYGAGTRSFLPRETGLVVIGALAISALAVFLGCRQLLRLPAVQLMQGAAPAGGGRKARRSAHRTLYSRLILRNMHMDWTRVLVTIASVAGGCLLMVIGFTLRHGISGVTARQFGGVMTYEAEVTYNADENPRAAEELDKLLTQYGLPHVHVAKYQTVFDADGALSAVTLVAAEDTSLDGFFRLCDIDSGEALALPDSGALVTRRFWECYGVDIGESVKVYDTALQPHALRNAGVFENYFGQFFFMTPQGYEEAFLSAPEKNCFFVKTRGMELELLRQKLASVSGLVNVSDAAAERSIIDRFTGSLKLVVWLMLFLAAAMACFIVANFTVTFIQRKTRELTIMRINGFTAAECIRYLAADIAITTVVGTLLGLALGGLIGSRILRVTETPYIQMIRESAPQSYLYSALINLGFSAVTNGFALRRVRNLKLSDIT